MKMNRYGFLLCMCAILFSCKSGPELKEDTLAVIGKRVIDTDDFIKRYAEFRRQTGDGVPDTYDARRKILNLYVDEEILISEAERLGLDKDKQAKHEIERIEMQELLNIFNRKEIAANVQVSEGELKELFVNLKTKIKARHIYASTKIEADKLYKSLMNGSTFEALAKQTFTDEQLKNSGGLLGYFSVDEMEPGFENAAFGLAIGEISKPIKTSDGYSIIRVEDRKTNPMITETEYAKHRRKLYPYWRNRKVKQAIAATSDSLGKSLNISFHESTLQKLFEAFEENVQTDKENESAFGQMPLTNAVLVDSKIGSWKVKDFQNHARFTAIEHQKFIRNVESFKSFIAGLLVRQKILSMAKAKGLHKSREYESKVTTKKDTYLLTRIENEIQSNMVVPEDSLKRYYHRHQNVFAQPAKINLREIVLHSRETAKKILRKLNSGESFSELARKYSDRKLTAANGGELGFLTAQDFGKWSELVFSMEPGDRKGPVQMDSALVILECIDKTPAEPRSFEVAREDVIHAVRFAMKDGYRSLKIQDMRKNKKLNVMAFKLKQLNIHL